MSTPPALTERTLARFADALAERTPTPGGGSLAAFLAAGGAALAAMACRFTSGEKYAASAEAMASGAATFDGLRPKALALVDRDAEAYDAVTAAYALPKATEAEKAERSAAIQKAMKAALDVPFETMQLALAGLEAAAPLAARLNPNLASDCGVGARCFQAALEGAFLNVRINARSLKDAEYGAGRVREGEAMRARAAELVQAISRDLDAHLG